MNFRKKFVFYKFFDENQVRKFFRIKKSTAGTAESYASGRTKITDFLKRESVSSNEGRSPSL